MKEERIAFAHAAELQLHAAAPHVGADVASSLPAESASGTPPGLPV
jgi:hypothetical protein